MSRLLHVRKKAFIVRISKYFSAFIRHTTYSGLDASKLNAVYECMRSVNRMAGFLINPQVT